MQCNIPTEFLLLIGYKTIGFGKNQPNLLFWWRETCWRAFVARIRVYHCRTGTCSIFLILLCISLKSNNTTFSVQFENNLHSRGFSKRSDYIRPTPGSCNFDIFWRTHSRKLISSRVITYTNYTPLSPVTIIYGTLWRSLTPNPNQMTQ